MFKLRSIPKAQSRLTATTREGVVRIEHLHFRDSYLRKQAELVYQINRTARQLQSVQDCKNAEEEELKEAQAKKCRLEDEKEKISDGITGIYKQLEVEQKRKESFLESIKKESDKGKEELDLTKQHLQGIVGQIQEKEPMARELMAFIEQEKDARERFLKVQDDLSKTENEYKKIKNAIKTEQEGIDREKREFDAFKTYVTELYGKLATYVRVAKETLEYVNEELEKKGTPIRFALPPGELLNINLDNFDKE